MTAYGIWQQLNRGRCLRATRNPCTLYAIHLKAKTPKIARETSQTACCNIIDILRVQRTCHKKFAKDRLVSIVLRGANRLKKRTSPFAHPRWCGRLSAVDGSVVRGYGVGGHVRSRVCQMYAVTSTSHGTWSRSVRFRVPMKGRQRIEPCWSKTSPPCRLSALTVEGNAIEHWATTWGGNHRCRQASLARLVRTFSTPPRRGRRPGSSSTAAIPPHRTQQQ